MATVTDPQQEDEIIANQPADGDRSEKPDQSIIQQINEIGLDRLRDLKTVKRPKLLETVHERKKAESDRLYEQGARAERRQTARVERFPGRPIEDEELDAETKARLTPPARLQSGKVAEGIAKKAATARKVAAQKAATGALRTAVTRVAAAFAVENPITWIIVAIIVVIFVVIVGVAFVVGLSLANPVSAGTSQVQPISRTSTADMGGLDKALGSGPISKAAATELLETTKALRQSITNERAASLLDEIDRAANTIITTNDSAIITTQSDTIKAKVRELISLLPASSRIMTIATSLLGTDNTNYYENPRLACASFVSTVLKKAALLPPGCQIVRSSTKLVEKIIDSGAVEVLPRGTLINNGIVARLKAGDLLFFNDTTPGFKHSAIYAGDGNFIAISSSKGIVVKNDLVSYPSYQELAAYRYP